ncbi:trans-aconitate 2-methyltransferase [Marinomonas sp. RS-M-Aa-14]|uniref:class I SAM-dependent methyltransferase n=1 Tax=Marinomonas sp. RS-M-Aa-14 TaxID=3241169 RepID=UPI00390C946C
MTQLDYHELQTFWDLAGSQVKMKALEVALSRSLFDVLLEPCSIEEIAHKLAMPSTNIKGWLDLLWSMGCIDKVTDNQYVASALAKRYMTSTSSMDCSQALQFRFQTLRRFTEQFEALLYVSKNNTALSSAMAPLWAKAAKAQIFQEQRAVTVPALDRILGRVLNVTIAEETPLHFLDLGGGPGLVALSLARRFPNSTGVLFDFPETANIAYQNVMAEGLEHRIDVQSGDLNTQSPTGRFDLIWCSSVLHFIEDANGAIKRISALLKPNGFLLILHAEQTAEKKQCEGVLPFYLPMVMKGNYLPKQGEIAALLDQNGLEVIQTEDVIDFPMAPVRLYCGRKTL